MSFTAKDVAALRAATAAGMMDCKRALEECAGDMESAKQWLREKGLGRAAERGDRENNQGCVALIVDGGVGAIVQLKCETDFVAASDQFKTLAESMAQSVIAGGADAVGSHQGALDDLKIILKENIELGQVVHMQAAEGAVLDYYLHQQGGRGVNAVLVEMSGGSQELAHDIAVHVGFAKPRYLAKDDVPAEVVAAERVTLEAITRNEGKPEQAIPKVVDGRIAGFFKEICLLEQPYAKDDKQTVQQVIGSAAITRYAQVVVG